MSNWGDLGWFGGLRIYKRLFTGDLSAFICCDERFMLAEVIREIYQLSVRIYQGLAFEGHPRKELAGKMGANSKHDIVSLGANAMYYAFNLLP